MIPARSVSPAAHERARFGICYTTTHWFLRNHGSLSKEPWSPRSNGSREAGGDDARAALLDEAVMENNDIRVVLVYPSTHQGVRSLFTFHKNEGIGYKPPLGILILATYLRSQGFSNVSCLDTQLDDLSPEETVDRLAVMRPDVVGLTVWTDFWYPSWKTAKLLRERLPEVTIVMGGPHCAVYPKETIEHSEADYVVAGDGEDTLLGLLRDLGRKRRVDDRPGLWRKENGAVDPPSVAMATVGDISKIPGPDRLLLPYKRYNSVINPNEFETTMITSRGCPHKCVFCKMHVQKVYARPAEQVIDEFREIAELGITDIQVYDDTFTWSKKRVIDICEGILDNNIKVRWAIRDRVKGADPEVYRLMNRAGCYRIHFGVESGSPPVLKASGKGITLEQVDYAVKIAREAGFATMAYYMFGFLDETYSDAMQTIRYSLTLDTDYAVYAVLIPYPATTLYESALERKIIPYDFWLEYTKNPAPDFTIPHLVEQHMDRGTLIGLKNMALRRYYFRPKVILREIKALASLKELRRKSVMASNIITDSVRPLFEGRAALK